MRTSVPLGADARSRERQTVPRVCSMTIEAWVSGQPGRVRTTATDDSSSTLTLLSPSSEEKR